ncbi:peptide ABC transporter substrate-binding protein [Reinekea thalattae]|uniref:Peptide ABC transporter substrate-binding protein n=1 Tax=Reinekea thalattae TaxID=2593301 RepID=A0A5C8Z1E0_9GAMM|nr:peptide ABC transporter substrate-binding protein [Reinekea thalattae]TXR51962.1 peptide ABC transporter substrate-binding protein [Reinekea thalattae]
MTPFKKTLAATLVGSAIFLAGCSNDDATSESAATDAAASGAVHPITGEALAADQTFTYWALDEHSSFDPQIVEDVSGSEHVRNLFEGLLNQDADGNLVPGVAERYEASEDKKTYTFYLREDAKWSNGDPVTAGDFVYAWQRAVNPETASPYAWYMEIMSIVNGAEIINGEAPIESLGVEAIDEHTLKVELTDSLPYFPMMVVHTTTFPAHKATIEKFGSEWTKPGNMISNGAYTLSDHVVNERAELVRNPMYWDNENTIIEKIVAIVVPDENQGLIRWKAGEFDLMSSVPTGQFTALQEEFPGEAIAYPRLCNYYYTFNLSESGPEAFKDVRVRKALAYALDRKVITEQILQGGQPQAYTFTPGATANFEVPSVEFASMTQAERDEAAKALLAEAGYSAENPLQFDMLYNTSEGHKQIATAMSQMWKAKLGVEATMNNMEWKTFLTERGNQNFEMARGAWCGDYNEASTFLDLLRTTSGYNDGKYSNAEVDRLMDEAKTMADPSANYTAIEQILAEEMPVIPVYHYAGNIMLHSNVKGWPVNNVEQNWYARNLYKVAE